jgi:hypothetical protein
MVIKLKDFFLTSEFKTGKGKIFSYKYRMDLVAEYCQGEAWSCKPKIHVQSMKDMCVEIAPGF